MRRDVGLGGSLAQKRDQARDPVAVGVHPARNGLGIIEFVQRVGKYDGYGTDNAPVRLAAQS